MGAMLHQFAGERRPIAQRLAYLGGGAQVQHLAVVVANRAQALGQARLQDIETAFQRDCLETQDAPGRCGLRQFLHGHR